MFEPNCGHLTANEIIEALHRNDPPKPEPIDVIAQVVAAFRRNPDAAEGVSRVSADELVAKEILDALTYHGWRLTDEPLE